MYSKFKRGDSSPE
jgi:hypothetical protein